MPVCEDVSSYVPGPNQSWHLLVERSIGTWQSLRFMKEDGSVARPDRTLETETLRSYDCLDEFLLDAPKMLMFWFFHMREAFLAQRTLKKWNQDMLDEYVLLPATIESVNRNDCFFMSHFWHSKDHPDPNGDYLCQYQQELAS